MPSVTHLCTAVPPGFSPHPARLNLASDGAPGLDLGIHWEEASSSCSHGSQSPHFGQEHESLLVLEPRIQLGQEPRAPAPVVSGGKTETTRTKSPENWEAGEACQPLSSGLNGEAPAGPVNISEAWAFVLCQNTPTSAGQPASWKEEAAHALSLACLFQ